MREIVRMQMMVDRFKDGVQRCIDTFETGGRDFDADLTALFLDGPVLRYLLFVGDIPGWGAFITSAQTIEELKRVAENRGYFSEPDLRMHVVDLANGRVVEYRRPAAKGAAPRDWQIYIDPIEKDACGDTPTKSEFWK